MYPAYCSIKALESGSKADDTKWLTYWVVFGAFNIIDHFAGFILHFIPFYYVLKLAFLVFLFHPKTKGATWVYDSYLRQAVMPLDKLAEQAAAGLKGAKHTE